MNRIQLIAVLAFASLPAAALGQTQTAREVPRKPPSDQVRLALAATQEQQAAPPSSGIIARWGVQLAGGFSKEQALASFARAQHDHFKLLGTAVPLVIAAPLGSRGPGMFYRVRIATNTRSESAELCDKIHSVGGSCIVLPVER